MDLQKLLREKASYFENSEENRGISSVISHIEIAEKHYDNGKKGEEYLFNDVIYRSNQAFEGSLKEAYRIFAENEAQTKTPYQIEKYLEDNSILKERVLQQFRNYRTEWRNVSTHDYTVYFTEQEAFLAIVSISAFISILLDQMIEKKAFEKEIHILDSQAEIQPAIIQGSNFVDKLLGSLEGYSSTIPALIKGSTIPYITESEITGSIMAYFKKYDDKLIINREVLLNTNDKNRRQYADFIFEKDNDKIIMEIKKYPTANAFNMQKGVEQLLNYMTASNIKIGILFIPPLDMNLTMEQESVKKMIDKSEYIVYKYYPKRNLTTAST